MVFQRRRTRSIVIGFCRPDVPLRPGVCSVPQPSSARRPLPAASLGTGREVWASPGAAPTPNSSHVPPTPPGSKGAKGHTGLGRQHPNPAPAAGHRVACGVPWGFRHYLTLPLTRGWMTPVTTDPTWDSLAQHVLSRPCPWCCPRSAAKIAAPWLHRPMPSARDIPPADGMRPSATRQWIFL